SVVPGVLDGEGVCALSSQAQLRGGVSTGGDRRTQGCGPIEELESASGDNRPVPGVDEEHNVEYLAVSNSRRWRPAENNSRISLSHSQADSITRAPGVEAVVTVRIACRNAMCPNCQARRDRVKAVGHLSFSPIVERNVPN